MVELADTSDLGSDEGISHAGSTPAIRIKNLTAITFNGMIVYLIIYRFLFFIAGGWLDIRAGFITQHNSVRF